jgi:hypothetical protein
MEQRAEHVHDDLACVTDAVSMWRTVTDQATDVGGGAPNGDPELELRERLPVMLATLSPAAMAVLRDHLAHVEELVAAVWACKAALEHAES